MAGIRPRSILVALIAASAATLVVLVVFTVRATILVDQIPGADAGLATRADLQQSYLTMGVSAAVFTVLALTTIGLVVTSRRRKHQ